MIQIRAEDFPVCARCRRQVPEMRCTPGLNGFMIEARCHGQVERMEIPNRILEDPAFRISRGLAFANPSVTVHPWPVRDPGQA